MRDTLHKCVVAGLAVGLCALWIAVGLASGRRFRPAGSPGQPVRRPPAQDLQVAVHRPGQHGRRIDDIEVVESDTAIQYVASPRGCLENGQ